MLLVWKPTTARARTPPPSIPSSLPPSLPPRPPPSCCSARSDGAQLTLVLAVPACYGRSLLRVEHGADWTVSSVHTEKVKSYAPRIYHIVFDFLCTPTAK